MDNKQNFSKGLNPRENFLMSIINKLINEYKTLLNYFHLKPFKIVEIISLTTVPGETKFAIQITHKNCILFLTAAEIIQKNYDLVNFSDFHAEMIRKACEGKLVEFLKLSERNPTYKIVSKRFDSDLQQYIFTLENQEATLFKRTARELFSDKNVLSNIDIHDVYDIGYTQGAESILKEKAMILITQRQNLEST